MKSNYLKYLFKSRKSLCVVILVIYAVVFVICNIVFGYKKFQPLIVLSAIAFVLAYSLIPILYSFIHDKKAVDSYFALPVNRKELLIANQIFIDLVVLLPFVFLSLFYFLLAIINGISISISVLVIYVLICVIGILIIVLFNTMIYSLANSIFDGVIMILAYAMLPILLMMAIIIFQENLVAGVYSINESYIMNYVSLPGSVISCLNDCLDHSTVKLFPLIVCVLWHIIVSIVGLKKHFISRDVERAETISNDFFSYPIIIYIYSFALILFTSLSLPLSGGISLISEHLILYVVIFICFLIANFVYRRKIAIMFKDVLYFVVVIVLTIAFSRFAVSTKGFGLAYSYNHNYINIAYQFNQNKFDLNDSTKDEIKELVKKVYPNATNYSLWTDGEITKSKMEENKDIVELLENKRQAAIENFYLRESDSYLLLNTNFDESAKDKNYLVNPDSHNYTRYGYAPNLTLAEAKKLNRLSPIYIEIEIDRMHAEYIQVTLDDLIKM